MTEQHTHEGIIRTNTSTAASRTRTRTPTHDHQHVEHEHTHTHEDGTEHTHGHVHQSGLEEAHNHAHTDYGRPLRGRLLPSDVGAVVLWVAALVERRQVASGVCTSGVSAGIRPMARSKPARARGCLR